MCNLMDILKNSLICYSMLTDWRWNPQTFCLPTNGMNKSPTALVE
jgi:hypothetical protein